MQELIERYNKEKHKIKDRLREFGSKKNCRKKELFAELCFCLLTPQSKAIYCDEALKRLIKTGLLYRGSVPAIQKCIKGLVRFHNKKAEYLVCARKALTRDKGRGLKGMIYGKDIGLVRERLVKEIKGVGYKEASHFLRNVGLGKNIAILDTHILKNLKRLNVIDSIPSSISRKTYLEIEGKMKLFAGKIKIPIEELDLLFWSNQTGFIFK